MIKLGIIGAMEQEVETLLAQMENKTAETVAGSTFYEGRLSGLDVVVVQCGIGKVNAALCVQILCTKYGITHAVNTGIAGSLCAQLDIGDLVVSKDAMYHDFDCVHFGYPHGKVPGMDVVSFPADEAMIGYAFSAAEAVNPGFINLRVREAFLAQYLNSLRENEPVRKIGIYSISLMAIHIFLTMQLSI